MPYRAAAALALRDSSLLGDVWLLLTSSPLLVAALPSPLSLRRSLSGVYLRSLIGHTNGVRCLLPVGAGVPLTSFANMRAATDRVASAESALEATLAQTAGAPGGVGTGAGAGAGGDDAAAAAAAAEAAATAAAAAVSGGGAGGAGTHARLSAAQLVQVRREAAAEAAACSLLVYSGSDDGTMRLWDARTGACLRVVDAARGSVLSIVTTGRAVWTATETGSILSWSLGPDPQLLGAVSASKSRVQTLLPMGPHVWSCGQDSRWIRSRSLPAALAIFSNRGTFPGSWNWPPKAPAPRPRRQQPRSVRWAYQTRIWCP